MAHVITTTPSVKTPDWDEHCEKTLLPPTDPNAEIIEISVYKLVYCNGACPKYYRVYKAGSMLGLVFQHISHWSNEVDEIHYTQPLNAVIALEDFPKTTSIDKTVAA